MGILRRLAAAEREGSLSNRMRSRRFEYFESLYSRLTGPVSILDLGGTVRFWECRGWMDKSDVKITLLNLESESVPPGNITSVAGDATDLSQYGDGEFDVVFSNSVIEHVFTYQNQQSMAREVERVGKSYWVQTPNYYFPIEPHFHWLGWQWYPRSLRVAAIRRFKCGHRGPHPQLEDARDAVDEVRLMSRGEMKRMFPGGRIWNERVLGFTKSLVAIGGFGGEPLPRAVNT